MTQVDNFSTPDAPLNMAQLKAFLDGRMSALLDGNRGTSAPPNPVSGMLWWDSATTTEVLKRYTVAAGWVPILSINRNSGILSFSTLKSAATADILGTVSQSGGVPTGALFEYGSNANGSYIRFADGTQICWHAMADLDCTTAAGALFISSTYTWTLPAAFVSNTYNLSGTHNNTTRWLVGTAASATSATLRTISYANGTAVSVRPVAVGRWY